MGRVRYAGILAILASVGFLGAFFGSRRSRSAEPPAPTTELPPDASDSLRLASLGLAPGPQLVVYVFGGSRCAYCRRPEIKAAVAGLRDSLRAVYGARYASISVVGVAINTDLEEGLGYLRSIGLSAFDEISTGKGWQNEEVIRWIQRNRSTEPAVPLIIAVTRTMRGTVTPLSVQYTADSIVAVRQGDSAVVQWLRSGLPLRQ